MPIHARQNDPHGSPLTVMYSSARPDEDNPTKNTAAINRRIFVRSDILHDPVELPGAADPSSYRSTSTLDETEGLGKGVISPKSFDAFDEEEQ